MDRLTQERRSWLMSRVKSKNTTTELVIRRLVFGMGFRYRLHDKTLPGKPDMVFSGRRKIVFVNGCFWHGHQDCPYGRLPKSKTDFWKTKIEKNRIRDKNNIELLTGHGWKVLVVWQCELKKAEILMEKLYDFLEHQ